MIFASRRYVRFGLWLLTLAAIIFVVQYARSLDYSTIEPLFNDLRWAYWIGAAGLAVVHVIVCGVLFSNSLDAGASRRSVLPVFIVSQVAKYVPGRIWGMVMQKALIGEAAPAVQVLSANGRVTSTVILSQLLLLGVLGGALELIHPVIAVSILLVSLGSGAMLTVLARRTGWLVLAAWQGSGAARGSVAYVLASAVSTAAAWAMLYTAGLGLEWRPALESVAVSAGSFLAGLASVLPAGLGLRDAAFIVLGGASWMTIDGALLPALAIASRVWLFVSDLLCAVVGFLWLMLERCKHG